MKIHDKLEIMINDEILTGIVDGISTRETDRELWSYYNIKLDQKNWSITLTHLEEKNQQE